MKEVMQNAYKKVAKLENASILNKMWYYRSSYILIAPFVIMFLTFTIIPVISSMILGFTHFNGLSFPTWCGFDNYQRLFLEDEVFLIAVKNTIIFAVITGPVSYFVCFLFAWLINELPKKVKTFATVVYYAPSLAGAGVIFIWQFIFSGDAYGFVNGNLMKLGFISDPIQWFNDPQYNLGLVIMIQIWISLGASFLAFIAGFQTIDATVYEAGIMDGVKNRFQELFFITIPMMKPFLFFGAVMQIASSFAAGAIGAQLGGFPSTNYSLHTIVNHITDYGTVRYEIGYACAMSFLLSLAMIFTRNVITKLLKTDD